MLNYSLIIEELSNLNPPQQSFDNRLILQALKIIGNPQYSYKVIHIAGTNGKGSTAAFLEAGLLKAGYKVGKFSSPYIHCINECICINGRMITDSQLVELYLKHKAIMESHKIFLSSFEMLTLLMFIYCQNQQIDYLVLETGLGGKDDSTNVVDSQYSIITNISLEHTQFLGSSLIEIANHKAGIIKNGLTVIGDDKAELVDAVKMRTHNYVCIQDKYVINKTALNHDDFVTEVQFIDGNSTYDVILGLFGSFQVNNFLCAFTVLRDIGIPFEIIKQSAAVVKWSGRLQKIQDNPLMIADASHNLDGVTNLANSLISWFNFSNSVIICSILSDKNREEMINQYARISANIIFCGIPNQQRTSNAEYLASLANGKFNTIEFTNSPEDAMLLAQKQSRAMVLISGSCYLLKYFISNQQK